jgi:hypothetical protein
MHRLSAVVTNDEYGRVDRFVRTGAAKSVAELVRLAVKEYMAGAGANKLLNLRDIPLPAARQAVEQYLKKHHGVVWPDEMAEELGIDYRVVLKVVDHLLNEKKVKHADPESVVIQI